MTQNIGKAPAIRPTEALRNICIASKPTRLSRRRASRRAPHYTKEMEHLARRILSAARMDPEAPELPRQLEGIPRGAWPIHKDIDRDVIHEDIDRDAKHAISALRRGEYRLFETILKWDYTLDVNPHYLARDCERLRRLYWESFQ